jgi:hypothetical protein
MLIDAAVMSVAYILAWINWNWYVTLIVFMCMIWYWQSRRSFVTKHLLHTLKNKKYKATILSIYSQIESFLGLGFGVWVWYLMWVSFGWWFLIIWLWLLGVLSLYYYLFASKSLDTIWIL